MTWIFRKPTSPPFIDKAGCTRQFENELDSALICTAFSHKGRIHLLPRSSSMVFTTPSVPLVGDRNGALNRYAIRLAAHQRSTPGGCAGWDCRELRAYSPVRRFCVFVMELIVQSCHCRQKSKSRQWGIHCRLNILSFILFDILILVTQVSPFYGGFPLIFFLFLTGPTFTVSIIVVSGFLFAYSFGTN